MSLNLKPVWQTMTPIRPNTTPVWPTKSLDLPIMMSMTPRTLIGSFMTVQYWNIGFKNEDFSISILAILRIPLWNFTLSDPGWFQKLNNLVLSMSYYSDKLELEIAKDLITLPSKMTILEIANLISTSLNATCDSLH